ncbi:MAG TPA: glycogen/starch synthase, partial [Synergistales bacterium]|nr:glycogen/starch synthase [Synergistales bacterium]
MGTDDPSGVTVLHGTPEMAPLSKVGGLADVAGSLPLALAELGHDVRVIMPKYLSVAQGAEQGHWPLWRAVPGVPVPMAGWTSGCA